MKREDAQERAYILIATFLPPSWVEKTDSHGNTQMTPKAVRFRDEIADSLLVAFNLGKKSDTLPADQPREGG